MENTFYPGAVMNKQRDNNYDLLRIVSAIAVISIHVSSIYTHAFLEEGTLGQCYTDNIFVTCLYNALSRFAVPCFFMLSGAFILDDEKNADFKFFYRKKFRKEGITALIFCGIYFLGTLVIAAIDVFIKGYGPWRLLSPVLNTLKGEPYYHLWYLFVLPGVYILTPIVIRVKKDIGEKLFVKAAWIFLVLSSVSYWTGTHRLNWDIGYQFYFLGYFMAGYVIRKWACNKKNNRKGICLIMIGIIIELLVACLQYRQFTNANPQYDLVSPLSPFIVVASVFIFGGFSLLTIRKDLRKASRHTFLIYLIHPGILSVGEILFKKRLLEGDNRFIIPISIALVYLLSYIAALIYGKISNRKEL